jgi:hypothetical protein
MIIEFNKKSNFYDDLASELYKINRSNIILYNFTPVEICGENYILTSSKNLEGYLMDYNKDVDIKIHIKNEINNIESIDLKLSNIVVFGSSHEQNDNIHQNKSPNQPDCYIDLFSNLLLIKFNSSKLNFINIDNNLNCDEDLKYNEEEIKLKYIWFDESFELKRIYKSTKILNVWNNKYINLPPIPLMIDIENTNDNTLPITGSPVYDDNDKFLGIVSYINNGEITSIPLICIKKMFDYLLGYDLLYLGLDLEPIKLHFKSGLNNVNYSNGLLITNKYYNNLLSANKKNVRDILENIFEKSNLDKNIENIANELTSLFKNELNTSTNDIIISSKNTILNKLIKKNNLCKLSSNYENLKKGYIICSIDNYKIDSMGNIIISDIDMNDIVNTKLRKKKKKYKIIPFKSYIWLFKNSRNNIINLKNISSNNYRGDLTKINNKNNELVLNDSCIKKQINLTETSILIESNFKSISSFGLDELKYITYNSIKLFELNEKILEIIKNFICENQFKYKDIISYIFNNKYTYEDKKMMLMFNFNEKRLPIIKIVSKDINNFEDLTYKYKTNKELKDFMISLI